MHPKYQVRYAEYVSIDPTVSVRGSMHTRTCRTRWLNIDTIEKRIERRIVHFDVMHTRLQRIRYPKCAPIQSFIKYAKAATIEKQNLDCITTFSEKHKQRTAARLVADLLFDQSREPIKRKAHVDRLESYKDLCARWDHDRAPSASTICRNSVRSNPARTSTRAAPTAISMVALCKVDDVTTLAS